MKDSIDFYDKIYTPLFKRNYTRSGDRSKIALRAFRRYCDHNSVSINSVIDVGCAWCKALKYWRRKGIDKIVGVDVCKMIVRYCRKKGFKCVHTSATDLSMLEDKSFDLYMATDVYEHLRTEDLDDAINEAKRLSKKYILIRPHCSMDRRGRKNPKKALHLTVWKKHKWIDFFLSHNLKLLPIGDKGELHYKNVFLMEAEQ